MNGDAAINLLMLRLGNRTDTATRTACLSEMQLAQERMEGGALLPWFLRIDNTALSTTAGQEYVDISSLNFIREDDDWGGVWWKDTTITAPDQWVRIDKDAYYAMQAFYADSEAATPEKYAYMSERLYLRPFPADVYPLRIQGYARDTAVADTATTNLWLTNAADWLIAETGLVVSAHHLRDDDLAKRFAGMTADARLRVQVADEARRHAGRSYQMGDE
jgi:predicted nuclease of predicted toxin-antitoxin system